MATIQEIAEKAGVSRGTVDRALNNRGRINPQVAEKIRQIADELGYVTRSQRKGKDRPKKSGSGSSPSWRAHRLCWKSTGVSEKLRQN